MKVLTICTGWVSHQRWISDDDKADAAFNAINDAMAAHRKFSNDGEKVVTVDVGDGKTSFNIDSVVMIAIDDCAASEDTVIESGVFEARIKAKIAARLAPAP